MTTHPSVRNLIQQAASVADHLDLRTEAVALRTGLDGRDGHEARVVVAGETSRGKSRLINALLGRPLLSPVGPDVTTACWLTFRHAEQESAVAVLADDTADEGLRRKSIPLWDVSRYVTVDAEIPAVGVEVQLPAPVLEGLVIIDTPGVGGVQTGHARVTLAMLEVADALLFVCDCTQPLLVPELAFLEQAAQRVATIVLAAAKSDAVPDFEAVVDETRAILARRAALGAVTLVPVSAALGEHAAELRMQDSDQLLADELSRLSGLPELTLRLRDGVAGRADSLRLANLARLAGSTARRALAALDQEHDEEAGDTPGQQLRTETERLDLLLANRDRARLELTEACRALGIEPVTAFEDATAELRTAYRTSAASARRSALSAIPSLLEGDLAAAAVEATTLYSAGLQHLEQVFAESLAARYLLQRLTDHGGVDMYLPEVGQPLRIRGQSLNTVLSSFGVAKTAFFAAAAIVPTPVQLVAAGAFGIATLTNGLIREQRLREDELRNHLGAWVDRAIEAARNAYARELERRSQAVRTQVDAEATRRFAELAAEKERLDERGRAAAHMTAERARVRQGALGPQRAALEELRDRADEAVRHLQQSGVQGAQS